MRLTFSPEDEAFRALARKWLLKNAPKTPRPFAGPEVRAYDVAWQRRQFDAGWAGINWPVEYGGRGLSLLQQLVWYEEYARAGCPDVMTSRCFVGLNHAGPTIIHRGTEAQKREHLPSILSGDLVWCQGFSEPGAGSDLAGIRTRGRIEGNTLIVNGQKIWTSFAQDAQRQELLVRTDPDASRHGGMTWVICDMSTPGITVQPLNLLNGAPDVCQVFYDDVRIPVENIVGEPGQGWSVAMSTLAFERGTAMIEKQVQLKRQIAALIALAKETRMPDGAFAFEHEAITERIANLHADVVALQAMTYRNVSLLQDGRPPGAEGSMVKITMARLTQEISRAAMDLIGGASAFTPGQRDWINQYLSSYTASVGGGANEIQQEIIAERILGLPRGR